MKTTYASGGVSGYLANLKVDATSEYNDGWNDCIDNCTFHERYTRSASSYGGSGTTHYCYDSTNKRYFSVGANWYTTTRADLWRIPDKKT